MKLTKQQEKGLWVLYQEYRAEELRDKLVEFYLPVVKKLAQLFRKNSPRVNYGELLSAGSLALMMAIDRYDVQKNIKFETFVSRRIFGSFQDYARKEDILTRTARRTLTKLSAYINKKNYEGESIPSIEEVAKELEVTKKKIVEVLPFLKSTSLQSLDSDDEDMASLHEVVEAADVVDVSKKLIMQEFTDKCFRVLPKLLQKILKLRYFEHKSFKEISEKLGFSESYASILHANTIRHLRKVFSEEVKRKYVED